jgi:hypothetical protein
MHYHQRPTPHQIANVPHHGEQWFREPRMLYNAWLCEAKASHGDESQQRNKDAVRALARYQHLVHVTIRGLLTEPRSLRMLLKIPENKGLFEEARAKVPALQNGHAQPML